MKKYINKAIAFLGWTIGIIILLVLLLLITIQIPYIQNFAKDQAVAFLEEKIKTKVSIENLSIKFPNDIELTNVYFEQQNGDTLLFGEKLKVDISLFEILDNKIEINDISLNGVVAKIEKDSQDKFNFDYIIEAFASDKPKDTTAKPFVISLKTIQLDRISLTYIDLKSKNNTLIKLNHFDTEVKKFDLEQLNFSIPKINLDGLAIDFNQDDIPDFIEEKIEEVEKKSKIITPKIAIDQIQLSDIQLNYQNKIQKIYTKNSLKKLNLLIDQIDLGKNKIAINSLEIDRLNTQLLLDKSNKAENKSVSNETKSESNDWEVQLKFLKFKDIQLGFDNNNSQPINKGIDYNHLLVSDLNFAAQNIKYQNNEITASIDSLRLKDKSGLNIEQIQAQVFYGKTSAYLKELYIKTPQTQIQKEVAIAYKSMTEIQHNLADLQLNADIEGSRIAVKDLLLFAPDLAKTNPFKSNQNSTLYVDSKISGKIANLTIPRFELAGIGKTNLVASGKIIGLPKVETAYFDLKIKEINTSRSDIQSIIPPGTLPKNITLPNQLSLKGNFKGKISNFDTDLNLFTSDGSISINGHLNNQFKNKETYRANVKMKNLNVGKIIQNDSIGKISLSMQVEGKSFNPKLANAKINGTVHQAYFKRYNYQNIQLNGTISQGVATAEIKVNDPNLQLLLDATGDLNGSYPKAKIKLNLDIADLNKLNLHAGPLKIKGNIVADVPTADIDYLNAAISAHNISINNEVEEYLLDSISIKAFANSEKNNLHIKSQFINADVEGKYKLSQLVNSLKQTINTYYKIPTNENTNPKDTAFVPQKIAFSLKTKDHPLLYKLVPSLTEFQAATITGLYDNVNDSIWVKGDIPRLVFGTTKITKGIIDIKNDTNKLNYTVKVNPIESGTTQIPSVNISGNVSENIVNYNVLLQDKNNKDQYNIGGFFEEVNQENVIKILSENLLLNYEKWNIPSNNEIKIAKENISINAFELRNGENILAIQSQSKEQNSPIEVQFSTFEIGTLTNMIQKENLSIHGKLNGNVLLKDVLKKPKFTSDLHINDFMFGKDTLGNIHLKVDNEIAQLYRAQVKIDGFDNDVQLLGNYKETDETLDLNLDINKLNLKSIQGFTMGNLKNSEGFLSGNFKINGVTSAPKINGFIKFNQVAFNVAPLNSSFKDINEQININNEKIIFDNFLIKDEDNNLLQIVGDISHKTFNDFKFNLGINADNFKAVNSEESDNNLYFGKLVLDTKLRVKGDFNKPIIDGNIKINKDTKFNIALPQTDPSLVDREGIVEFVDVANPTIIKHVAVKDQVNSTQVKGIEAAVNIEIVKEAELSLIIDKANGDYLKLKGEAQLSGGIDPSGKTTLTGRYEFVEGTYEMSFNFLRRKFDIQKGSYILWKGEPTAADVNITAVYNTDVAPIDLLTGLDPAQQNQFKQKLSIDTQLKMKGELLKPEISFDIVLPEGKNNVSSLVLTTTETRLAQLRQQQTELDKQVFALLLLNRFIGENPFASQAGGGDAESMVRQSASKILSQQLNNLAGDLIEGIEIDFDLESQEDYTSGEKQNRTDLNVEISKRLLDDRLKVTVGSSFGLEGNEQDQRDNNNIAGDVAVEYQLSKDGKYTVRAYRKNKYQVALQGQVVETGVAFIITIDYNKFKELFHGSKERNNKNVKLSKDEKDE